MPRRIPLVTALALGCGTDNAPRFTTGPGVTSVAHSTSSSGTTATSTLTSTSTGGAEDSAVTSSAAAAPPFDMAPPPDLGDPTPAGCKGKIDFMFAISALGTMYNQQAALLKSLPGFMATIADDFADFDAHIMSVNVDGMWHGDLCESPDWCLNKGHCGVNAMDYECGKYVDLVGACDRTLGAGITFNAGGFAYNKPCDLGGTRYITSSTADQAEAFQCIAQVGMSGGLPPMADALAAAVSPGLNGPDGCNAGFLRPDALLVFLFVTDVEDQESWLSAKKVRDAVIAARSGDDDAVVALAIVPQLLEGEPVEGCTYNDPPIQQHLLDVIEPFPYHADGDICADDYSVFFQQKAASLVREACNAFIPQ